MPPARPQPSVAGLTYEAQAERRGELDEHTPYVISGLSNAHSRTQEVMSLVNTLTNHRNLGIRGKRGLCNQLCIDTTHRLVSEGHSVFVAGVGQRRWPALASHC